MTDSELIQNAAKAIGLIATPIFTENFEGQEWWAYEEGKPTQTLRPWNPLVDDGDALRLLVELGDYVQEGSWPYMWGEAQEQAKENDGQIDWCKVVRRTIVKAAANKWLRMDRSNEKATSKSAD